MEADGAFHLLHDLVDVTIQDRDRPEPTEIPERLLAVLRGPTPLRIDGPQRDVREHHDGRAGREPVQILLEPLELVLPERADAARLEGQDVHEPHEVDALVVEALPALAHRPPAVSVQVFLAAVGEDVVLARDVEHSADPDALERLGERVEGAGFLTVSQISGVQHELGRGPQRVDAVDGLLQASQHVLVGLAVESDVGVADLDEAEVAANRRRLGGLCEVARREHASAQHPDEAAARPRHAL